MKSQFLLALLAGTIFGLGLSVSGMSNPARVIGFLDVTGQWDPTLLLVMGSALLVTAIGFRLVLLKSQPVLKGSFHLPGDDTLDKNLVLGSILFGTGWGLAGFCPGPAITALVSLEPGAYLFVVAMISGFWLHHQWTRSSHRGPR